MTLACLVVSPLMAQEGKFKALFLVKFSEYVEWPGGNSSMILGVAGDAEVLQAAQEYAIKKEGLQVKKITSPADAKSCSIVFLSKSELGSLGNYISTIGQSSTLLVIDGKDKVRQGADIGFYLEDNKLRYLINKSTIESKKMIPSSRLISLGTVI